MLTGAFPRGIGRDLGKHQFQLEERRISMRRIRHRDQREKMRRKMMRRADVDIHRARPFRHQGVRPLGEAAGGNDQIEVVARMEILEKQRGRPMEKNPAQPPDQMPQRGKPPTQVAGRDFQRHRPRQRCEEPFHLVDVAWPVVPEPKDSDRCGWHGGWARYWSAQSALVKASANRDVCPDR